MKKLLVGMCLVMTAGMLSACGSKAEETTAAPATEVVIETTEVALEETAEETESAEAKETETETKAEDTDAAEADGPAAEAGETVSANTAEATGFVTGEITAVGMSSITIKTADGAELSFLKEETRQDVESDMVEGLTVSIKYSEEGGMQMADFITDATVVQGEVLDGTMSTLQIKTADGEELVFDKEGAETALSEGIVIGNQVAVAYRETENGANTAVYICDVQ